jgi:chitinase
MLQARVTLAGVNAMTMDFGSPGKPQRRMLAASESALRATHAQLDALYRQVGLELGSRRLWRRLGATVMIGENDVPGETFTTADARALVAFAREQGLGRLSMWSLNRDVECGAAFAQATVLSNSCSGVAQSPLQFSKTFAALAGSPAATSAATPADAIPELPQVAVDNPATSPYPVWREGASYRAGYKVVWHGDVYQAKWFSQGQMPDMPVQSQWATPWVLVGPVLPGEHPPKIPHPPANLYRQWSASATYRAGARVLYGGLPYRAKWYTRGEAPVAEGEGAETSPWQPLYTIPGEPTPSGTLSPSSTG